jgi:hypothetical protein
MASRFICFVHTVYPSTTCITLVCWVQPGCVLLLCPLVLQWGVNIMGGYFYPVYGLQWQALGSLDGSNLRSYPNCGNAHGGPGPQKMFTQGRGTVLGERACITAIRIHPYLRCLGYIAGRSCGCSNAAPAATPMLQ